MKTIYRNKTGKDSRQYAVGSRQKKNIYCSLLIAYCLLLTVFGCGKQVVIVTDSKYYEGKIKTVLGQLLKSASDTKEKHAVSGANLIEKVAVMDFVNANGKVSALGKYLGSKLSETIIESNSFKVAQRGEVLEVMKKNNIASPSALNNETIKKVGEGLRVDGIFFGEIIDLGTNIDVNVKFIGSKNGEILSAGSIDIERTKSVVNLMEIY